MIVYAFPAQLFDTNCYVIATGNGQECLVVDPGVGVVDTLRDLFDEHRLRPSAVLLTHGHADHTWSVTPVCGGTSGAQVRPAYIHTDDRHRLRDPLADLSPAFLSMLEQQQGARASWAEPSEVIEVTDGAQLSVAGIDLTVTHAPGHTEGSVLFTVDDVPAGLAAGEPLRRTVLSGDVLFAGSIGRTDLPGGSDAAMRATLRDVVLPLPDDTLVLPGHGPATTMSRERRTNPYLRGWAG